MDWLRPITYVCGVLWLLGFFEASGGGSDLGPALIDIFGTLTILLLVVQSVIWLRNRHSNRIKKAATVTTHWFRRSALLVVIAVGATLFIWMNAYETLPDGRAAALRVRIALLRVCTALRNFG